MKLLKWPIIYLLLEVLLLSIITVLFKDNILLINFLLAIFTAIIFIPLLIKNYKKQNIKNYKLNIKKIILLILMGILLSVFYNTFMFYLNKYLFHTNLFDKNNKILITLLSTGIIGPIIEELMFRGIIYNEAKNKYNNKKAIIITTIIFALLHVNFMQIIYAFIMGLIFIKVYEESKNIKAPIILHMASNITTTLYLILLTKDNLIINFIFLIISFIMLIVINFTKKRNMI